MKDRTKERTIRLLLASILASDLTVPEIRELSFTFISGDPFLSDLGYTLARVIDSMEIDSYSVLRKQSADSQVDDSDYFSQALNMIKKRRLPKQMILSTINEISPYVSLDSHNQDLSMKRILTEFFRTASKSDVNNFIHKITLDKPHMRDEYLKGIMRDREK
jgi:hypothetical protein